MKQFQITFFDGHPVITDGDNRILIDTGAPTTINHGDQLDFYEEIHPCITNYMGLTTVGLSEMLGTEITTLMGSDILSKYKVILDYANQVATFSTQELAFDGQTVALSAFMGIPVIELSVNEQVLKFFLDTGAKLSYLPEQITDNFPYLGIYGDFYPGVGEFETNCYDIPAQFGDKLFKVKFGNLPVLLQMTLMLGGTDGIIGFDFFDNFKVLLDLKKQIIKYNNHLK